MIPKGRGNISEVEATEKDADERVGLIEFAQGAIPGSIAGGAISGAYLPSILPLAIIAGAIFGMLTSVRINDFMVMLRNES
jgi:hypothetical protein